MPLRNMMQNLLNVMPDLKHCVETLPQKKGPGSRSQHHHNFPRSYGERGMGAIGANGAWMELKWFCLLIVAFRDWKALFRPPW